MNPKLTYDKIIDHALNTDRTGQKGAWHHIIPRCIGGSDNFNNLVFLTYKEHYFVHYLLTKIYPDEYGIWLAYKFMTDNGKWTNKPITARSYEIACIKNSELMKERAIKGEVGWGNNWKLPEFREMMSELASEHLSYYNTTKDTQVKQRRTKCLNQMYYWLCYNDIKHPTDDQILEGYKSRRGQAWNTWKKYFTNKEWIDSVREMLNKFEVVPMKREYRNITNTVNQSKSRILNAYWLNLVKQKFGEVHCNNDVTDEMIIESKWYDPKRRCWNMHKWNKYWTKDEWIQEVRKLLQEYPIEDYYAIHNVQIDNQQPS